MSVIQAYISGIYLCFKKKKDREPYDFYLWISFILLKDSLYIYSAETGDVRWEVFSCKWRKIEHHSRTQSADVDKQVSLGPHHPSCKTQGAASIKHKESLARNKCTQPTTGTQLPTVGKDRTVRHSRYAPVQFHCKRIKKKEAA